MNITYDSDKQSDSNKQQQQQQLQYSSDQQQQLKEMPAQQIAQYKKQIRLNKAIAYRYLMQKQQAIIEKVFKMWVQLTKQSMQEKQQSNNSMNMEKAIQFYHSSLLNKAFDGIIQYATVSISFRNKLVVFYYKYLLNRYFGVWKNGFKNKEIRKQDNEDQIYDRNSTFGKTVSQVSKNLDSILNKDKDRMNLSAESDRLSNITANSKFAQKPTKQQQQISIVQPNNSIESQKISRAAQFIQQINHKQQQHNINLAFNSIKRYIKTVFVRPSHPPPQINNNYNYNVRDHVASQSGQNYYNNNKYQQQYGQSSSGQQWRRNTAYDRLQNNNNNNNNGGNTLSRNRDMQQSRKSTATIYRNIINSNHNNNDDDQYNKSKSRRKLKPIVEQVSLPSFSKKDSNNNDTNSVINRNQFKQRGKERDISRKIQFRESQNRSEQRQMQIQRSRQKQRQRQRQRQRERQREKQRQQQQRRKQQAQKQKKMQQQNQRKQQQAQKQQNRNRILALITQNKLMQLTLMNQNNEQSNIFNEYRKSTIDLLKKIRTI